MVCGLALAAALALVRTEYRNRDRWREADFNHYYANTLLLRAGGNPWRVAGGAAGPQAAFNYPPAFYLLLRPLSLMAPRPAYWIWQAIQIAALICAVLIALREAAPGWRGETIAGAVALAFLFPQTYGSLYDSQPTGLLMLMLIGAWRLERRGHRGWAGALVATAALLKIYPAAVGGYFLFRRRFKTVAFLLICFAAGAALLIGLYGVDRNVDFLLGARRSMIPFWLDMSREVSIAGNIHWALIALAGSDPGAVASSLHGALALALDLGAVALAGAVTARSDLTDTPSQGLCWSLWLMVAILISPLAWAHYLILLIPFYIFGAARLAAARPAGCRELWHSSGAIVALLGLGLAGFVAPYFSAPLRDTHAYFFALLLTFGAACAMLRPAGGGKQKAW